MEGMQEELIFDEDICTVCGHKRLMNGGFFTQFSHAELAFSTYGFSQKYVLSKSRKRVYRGTLPSGLQIVVRKHFFATIKEYEFRSLALTLGNVRHENVATLLGFCSEGYHRFLVYEYACHQSLSAHLSARSKELTWERRLKIALGTCKGLQYLHTNNIFGCLRPKNILLTHDFKPQLANFGLTKNQYEDLNHLSEARVLKTFEYLAPEYGETGTDSSVTDVYSFGVVFLELLTGRKTIKETRGESFLRWARPLLEEKVYMELIDPLIKDDVNLLQLVLIVRLLESCLSYDPRERCSISEVVTDLTHIVETQDHSPI
ncbi:serine/threonine-protein kinase CDG1-like [Bidens hawaiensis]|uniref:serine/threonine-protein kinase CDG1-like n=1 Tax=Bidens hawaiensis TaxID=980011 RepID=UPI00404A0B06